MGERQGPSPGHWLARTQAHGSIGREPGFGSQNDIWLITRRLRKGAEGLLLILPAFVPAAPRHLFAPSFGARSLGQIDDLSPKLSGHCFQLSSTDTSLIHPQVEAVGGDDGKPRPAGALPGMTSMTYKDLAHRTLLPGAWLLPA
jgi:hypothetical protein